MDEKIDELLAEYVGLYSDGKDRVDSLARRRMLGVRLMMLLLSLSWVVIRIPDCRRWVEELQAEDQLFDELHPVPETLHFTDVSSPATDLIGCAILFRRARSC